MADWRSYEERLLSCCRTLRISTNFSQEEIQAAYNSILEEYRRDGRNSVGIELQVLFPWNCQCEHPWAYEHHIQNCLTTKEQVENFKNEVLRIVEQAAQNRSTQQPNPSTFASPSAPPTANSNPDLSTNANPPSSTFSTSTSESSCCSNTNADNSASSFPTSINNNNETANPTQSTLPKENSSPNLDNAKEETAQGTFDSSPSQKNDTPPLIPTTSLAGNKGEKASIMPNQSKPEHHPSSLKENSPKQVSEENQANIQTEQTKVIQEIQNKLKDLSPIDWKTLLNSKYQNWEQEISQLKSIEQITAYQKTFLQVIEQVSQSQLKQNIHASSTNQKKGKGMVPWIVLGVIILLSGLAEYLAWLKRKRKSKIVDIKRR